MISKDFLSEVSQIPIEFNYLRPSADVIRGLCFEKDVVILESNDSLTLDQSYYRMGIAGSHELTFLRSAVAERLKKAKEMLKPHFGIIVFDAFRSIQTQRALFDYMFHSIKTHHPEWHNDQVMQETRKYVVHPDENPQYSIPPHNSGGAIDLGLFVNEHLMDFGTHFDDPSKLSSTDFFESEYDPQYGYTTERWKTVRANRRLLFHTMCYLGFTNYREEWWHYDLGNCPWSEKFGLTRIFDSMEPEVIELCEGSTG